MKMETPEECRVYDEWYVNKPERYVWATTDSKDEDIDFAKIADIGNTYMDGNGTNFLVRDIGYVDGSNKEKFQSDEAAYEIAGLNVYRCKKNLTHIASKVESLKSYLAKYPKRPGQIEPEFMIFTWLFQSMWSREYTCVVHLFRKRDTWSLDGPKENYNGFQRTMYNFMNGSDEEKKGRVKFAAKLKEAPSLVKKTANSLGGERPVIICKKLDSTFHTGENYIEVDMDVGSSKVASMMNSAVLRACSKVVVEECWLLEAKDEDELPERVIGSVQSHYIQLDSTRVQLNSNYEPVV